MSKLRTRYPNFKIAMRNASAGTDTVIGIDDRKQVAYIMSLILFKNKVANIAIELNAVSNGVQLTMCTMKGLSEKARSSTQIFENDLSIQEWADVISKLMIEHNYSPNHMAFLSTVTEKILLKKDKSGCALLFICIVSGFLYFF